MEITCSIGSPWPDQPEQTQSGRCNPNLNHTCASSSLSLLAQYVPLRTHPQWGGRRQKHTKIGRFDNDGLRTTLPGMFSILTYSAHSETTTRHFIALASELQALSRGRKMALGSKHAVFSKLSTKAEVCSLMGSEQVRSVLTLIDIICSYSKSRTGQKKQH